MTLGRTVKEMREAKGWTQAQLASRARVERSTIQNVESGRVARPNSLPHIADALGVTVSELTRDPEAEVDEIDAALDAMRAAIAELERIKRDRRAV